MVISRLVLVSEDDGDVPFAQAVAEVCKLSFQRLGTKDLIESVKSGEPAVVFLEVDNDKKFQSFERSLEAGIGLYSDKLSANSIHVLTRLEIQDVPFAIKSPVFGHYVKKNYDDPIKAGKHYGRIVQATLADRAFGLEYLLGAGAKIQTARLTTSLQKQDAVEAVKNFLIASKFQTRMASVVANAVDELLMNAIFDAASDELGRQIYASVARTTEIKLEGKSAVEMKLGFDGEYVAISAIDLHGSLDKNKLMSHVSKVYSESEYRIKLATAGAGIGLATVFRSGGSLFFVSEFHSRTEVTVFFKQYSSYKDFKNQFRFLSTQFYF